jgi:hypothetical protein
MMAVNGQIGPAIVLTECANHSQAHSALNKNKTPAVKE